MSSFQWQKLSPNEFHQLLEYTSCEFFSLFLVLLHTAVLRGNGAIRIAELIVRLFSRLAYFFPVSLPPSIPIPSLSSPSLAFFLPFPTSFHFFSPFLILPNPNPPKRLSEICKIQPLLKQRGNFFSCLNIAIRP